MKELARSWLERQCKATPGASRGVVFLGAPDRGPYTPTALWPEGGKLTPPLAEAAEYAMSERRGLVRPPEPEEVEEGRPGRDVIALPFQIDGALWGAAAIEVRHRPKTEQQGVLQLLGWGCSGSSCWFASAPRATARPWYRSSSWSRWPSSTIASSPPPPRWRPRSPRASASSG
jgi:hypothetical protein